MAETTAATASRAQTRRRPAAATNRATAAKKAAATRARTRAADAAAAAAAERAAAAVEPAEPGPEPKRTPVERYVDLAGRAVTIPVGAAIVAGEAVVELAGRYSSREKVEREFDARRRRLEADLQTFERRGATARDRFERELGRRFERVEADLRTLRSAPRDAAAKAVGRVARVA